MPIYAYECEDCGHAFSEVRPADERNDLPTCQCGKTMYRDYAGAGQATHGGKVAFDQPIEMHSIAVCNEADIAAFRRRNPDVEIGTDPGRDDFGVPVARTRKQKKDILRREGFEERN